MPWEPTADLPPVHDRVEPQTPAPLADLLALPIVEEPPRRATGRYRRTVAFRITDEQSIALDALRSTFPGGSTSEAFQWFLSSAAGRELIAKKVRGEI